MAGKLYVMKMRPGDDAKILPDKTQLLRVDESKEEAPGTYYVVALEVVESLVAVPRIVVK